MSWDSKQRPLRKKIPEWRGQALFQLTNKKWSIRRWLSPLYHVVCITSVFRVIQTQVHNKRPKHCFFYFLYCRPIAMIPDINFIIIIICISSLKHIPVYHQYCWFCLPCIISIQSLFIFNHHILNWGKVRISELTFSICLQQPIYLVSGLIWFLYSSLFHWKNNNKLQFKLYIY